MALKISDLPKSEQSQINMIFFLIFNFAEAFQGLHLFLLIVQDIKVGTSEGSIPEPKV